MKPAMSPTSSVATAVLVRLGEMTNRTFVLPLLIFYPTSRCNSRCVSCDWWKQNGADDLTLEEIGHLAGSLPDFGTRVVAFSGGEPLLRPDVFEIAGLFRANGMRLQLLTSGVLLERFAEPVAENFERLTVSLDATTEALYQEVRGIAALSAVEQGIARFRRIAPKVPVSARATLHRLNFRELPMLIDRAQAIGFDRISFLAADVSSTAFGREHAPLDGALRMTSAEVAEFSALVEETIESHRADFESGFVAERPESLRRLPRYYAALVDGGAFPSVACNAPWMSVVLEADGTVRPCFFHKGIGNIRRTPLETILTSRMPAFRGELDVPTDPLCKKCVCSIRAGWRGAPWQ